MASITTCILEEGKRERWNVTGAMISSGEYSIGTERDARCVDFVPEEIDTKLKHGRDWKEEIQRALDISKAAILLINAPFWASDFITESAQNDELLP